MIRLPSPLPSAAEMKALDAAALKSVMAQELMERAGKGIFHNAVEQFPEHIGKDKRHLILVGPGNNGGDGIVIARALKRGRFSLNVVIAKSAKYSPDLLAQIDLFCGETGVVRLFGEEGEVPPGARTSAISSQEFVALSKEADCIFDALLGGNQSGAPRGSIAELISLCANRKSTAKVIAVDIPTGVDPTTGQVAAPVLPADLTVAVQFLKRGMTQSPAIELCGKINCLDIGIPSSFLTEFSLLTLESIPRIKRRAIGSHKGSVGKVLVVAGSVSMPGAAVLSTRAALRTGAGLVTAAAPEAALFALPPEAIHVNRSDPASLEKAVKSNSAVVIGPGLSLSPESESLVEQVLSWCRDSKVRCVVDADALTILAKKSSLTAGAEELFVFTPHPGEAARMLGQTTEEIQSDRFVAAQRIREKFGGTIILKGAGSIINSQHAGAVNSSGNPFMATAGSGDALAGILGTLLAQGYSLHEGCCLGVYLHGRAGDIAHGEHRGPIVTSDLIEAIPVAYGELAD